MDVVCYYETMKTLDDIIDQIHREQEEHNLRVIAERNEYMEELERKYQTVATFEVDGDLHKVNEPISPSHSGNSNIDQLVVYLNNEGYNNYVKFSLQLDRIELGLFDKWCEAYNNPENAYFVPENLANMFNDNSRSFATIFFVSLENSYLRTVAQNNMTWVDVYDKLM